MYYYLTELQTRTDGLVNNTTTVRSTKELGESLFFERCSKAVVSDMPAIALILCDQYGNICERKLFKADPATGSVEGDGELAE